MPWNENYGCIRLLGVDGEEQSGAWLPLRPVIAVFRGAKSIAYHVRIEHSACLASESLVGVHPLNAAEFSTLRDSWLLRGSRSRPSPEAKRKAPEAEMIHRNPSYCIDLGYLSIDIARRSLCGCYVAWSSP